VIGLQIFCYGFIFSIFFNNFVLKVGAKFINLCAKMATIGWIVFFFLNFEGGHKMC
jgi:hypothetical protein